MMIFVAAMDRNRGIGFLGRLPWHLPADLKFFRRTTLGHTVLMGRKTFDSIGRPLPDRTNIVLTGNTRFQAEGVKVIHSPEEAASLAFREDVYVIGGGEVFRLLMPWADKLILTRIDHQFPADVFFPALDESRWTVQTAARGITDQQNPYSYEFVELVRRGEKE